MWFWKYIREWKLRRLSKRNDLEVKKSIQRLAHEYETFPRLYDLKARGWLLVAPRYTPAVAETRREAIAKFRRLNEPHRHP